LEGWDWAQRKLLGKPANYNKTERDFPHLRVKSPFPAEGLETYFLVFQYVNSGPSNAMDWHSPDGVPLFLRVDKSFRYFLSFGGLRGILACPQAAECWQS
jgi:hypothetical protein